MASYYHKQNDVARAIFEYLNPFHKTYMIKKHLRIFFVGSLLSLLLINCQKEVRNSGGNALLATLTTISVSAVAPTTAVSGGTISSDGGATITARGVCWATITNPVVTGNHTTDGTGVGTFTSNITGLIASTTYYVRAYATNSSGTAYGNEISFTTTATGSAVLPTLTTTNITAITSSAALSGGNISSDGGASVTARGVCWSPTANPLVTGNHTIDGTGIGAFTSNIATLNSATTYYVRAYATNSIGTAYGNEISFTTLPTSPSSNKLKRIIASYATRKADIILVEYDASDRMTKFSEWTEDSTFTPIKITGANYISFVYSGTGTIPLKSTITHQPGGTGIDSTLYYYDATNRIIKEDCYKNNQITGRNDYTYLSPTKIIRSNYYSSGGPLILGRRDSMTFDSQNRILESQNTLATSTDKDVYSYDNKINPFATNNVFMNVYTLYVDDRKFYYRSPNNMTTYTNTVSSNILSLQSNYLYNPNTQPLSGTSILTYGTTVINYSLKYEYY